MISLHEEQYIFICISCRTLFLSRQCYDASVKSTVGLQLGKLFPVICITEMTAGRVPRLLSDARKAIQMAAIRKFVFLK